MKGDAVIKTNSAMHRIEPLTAHRWLTAFTTRSAALMDELKVIYGEDESLLQERLSLYVRALKRFIERYGSDEPVLIVRSPARINLRGMHVDTHGGCLNLMTHHRETVMVVALEETDRVEVVNVERGSFPDAAFDIGEEIGRGEFSQDWMTFIESSGVRSRVREDPGHWSHYIRGGVLSVQHRFRDRPLVGFRAVVNSDIPRGAALSSSHALVLVTVLAALAVNGLWLEPPALILAVQDGEWLTGARSGLSDQGAMVLCRRGQVLNAPLFRESLASLDPSYVPWPQGYEILVIHSFRSRSLSGAEQVTYTTPRFAYSIGLSLLKEELCARRLPAPFVESLRGLSDISPQTFEPYGGLRTIYEVLRTLPCEISLDDLRTRYPSVDIEGPYRRYFGSLPEQSRPTAFDLRGPLLYGIAESARAARFVEAIREERIEEAAELMCIGQDGDRHVRYRPDTGETVPYRSPSDDAYLDGLLADLASGDSARIVRAQLERQPGSYRASSPALDSIVDIALDAGAIGACLTGAGIAGHVLALVPPKKVEEVRRAVQTRYYERHRTQLLGDIARTEADFAAGIVVNRSIAPAGLLPPPTRNTHPPGVLRGLRRVEQEAMTPRDVRAKRLRLLRLVRTSGPNGLRPEALIEAMKLAEEILAVTGPRPIALVLPAAGYGTRIADAVGGYGRKHRLFLGDEILLLSLRNVSPYSNLVVIVAGPGTLEEIRRTVEGSEIVPQNGYTVRYVVQEDRLGDGDAVLTGLSALDDFDGDVLVVWSDNPIKSPDTIRHMVQIHQALGVAALTIPTLGSERPYAPLLRKGGRVVWNWQKADEGAGIADATRSRIRFGETNVGLYIGQVRDLRRGLNHLRRRFLRTPAYLSWSRYGKSLGERPPEYYLADIVRILAAEGLEIAAPCIGRPMDRLSVNNPEELDRVRQFYRERSPRTLLIVEKKQNEAIVRLLGLDRDDRLILHARTPWLQHFRRLPADDPEGLERYMSHLAHRMRHEMGIEVVGPLPGWSYNDVLERGGTDVLGAEIRRRW